MSFPISADRMTDKKTDRMTDRKTQLMFPKEKKQGVKCKKVHLCFMQQQKDKTHGSCCQKQMLVAAPEEY